MDLGFYDAIDILVIDRVAAFDSNDFITIGYLFPFCCNTYCVVPDSRRISLKPTFRVAFIFEDIQSLIHCLYKDA
jgi:hypothetical protein